MGKVGHSLLKKQMKEEKALLGGEMSGHMVFADRYFGYDDAIYASCRLLEILSQTTAAFRTSQRRSKTYHTPRSAWPARTTRNSPSSRRSKSPSARNTHRGCGRRPGAFSDGWGLVRASNTQARPGPALRSPVAGTPAGDSRPGGGESEGTVRVNPNIEFRNSKAIKNSKFSFLK